MYHTFYIKIDDGNNVIDISTQPHDKPWMVVSVDDPHLNSFKNDYSSYKYDPVRCGLLAPDGTTTDQEIPNMIVIQESSPNVPNNSDGGNNAGITQLNNKIEALENKVKSMRLNGLKIKDIENN